MVTGLVLLYGLALRWLLVTRRRLAYEAAMERQRAALEEAEQQEYQDDQGELHFEEEEVDIAALSDETRGLIRILMLTATVVGIYLIWFSALPALQHLVSIGDSDADVLSWEEFLARGVGVEPGSMYSTCTFAPAPVASRRFRIWLVSIRPCRVSIATVVPSTSCG